MGYSTYLIFPRAICAPTILDFSIFVHMQTTDLKEVAMKIANEDKAIGNRTVVITQGSKPVLVAKDTEDTVTEYPVPKVDIVDTNGAGDAFTGGFLSQFIQEKPFDTCMKCAIYCASEYVSVNGLILALSNLTM